MRCRQPLVYNDEARARQGRCRDRGVSCSSCPRSKNPKLSFARDVLAICLVVCVARAHSCAYAYDDAHWTACVECFATPRRFRRQRGAMRLSFECGIGEQGQSIFEESSPFSVSSLAIPHHCPRGLPLPWARCRDEGHRRRHLTAVAALIRYVWSGGGARRPCGLKKKCCYASSSGRSGNNARSWRGNSNSAAAWFASCVRPANLGFAEHRRSRQATRT